MPEPVFVFTDAGRMVLGTLADWAVHWKYQTGAGHRQMSFYLLSWSGDSTPPALHYIKITHLRNARTWEITADGLPDPVYVQ